MVLAAAALVLSGCAGAPEPSGTLGPLPSVTPSASASGSTSEAPSATATPSATAGGSPSASPEPTPTATPTAPVPDGLTAEQLEAAAFVEEYHQALAEAVDLGDLSVVEQLQTEDCPCRTVLPLLQGIIDEGATREGGQLVVLGFDQITGGDGRAEIVLRVDQRPGAYVYPDGSRAEVIPTRATDLLIAVKGAMGWRVAGIQALEVEEDR